MLGWIFLWLSLAVEDPFASVSGERMIIEFDRTADADQVARALCLQYGCRVRHVYRGLPGAAVQGGRLATLARAQLARRVALDLLVRMQTSPIGLSEPQAGRP